MNNIISSKVYCLTRICISISSLTAQERPNILIITTDEHNFRTLNSNFNQYSISLLQTSYFL